MSVPTWKRNVSKIEFLFQTYQLEKEIVQLIYNTPSKYRHSFGDTLILCCDEALRHGRTANDIYVKDDQTLNLRLYELSQMKAAIDNVGTHVYVWIEAVRHHDGISPEKTAKYYDKEERIGILCDHIIALIEGVKRSDKIRYKEMKEKATA